ncbi:HAD-IIB family hydrolase [Paenibacillus sp. N1-5-1-14]|uniref:HAD-IIB family hydrolase n=1 Tax=Paenibacillus radicibacter TaxID=2972488 RepID=UPI002159A4C3|nr:HAD-IIB family hydrolase [Paenibacillus radicibacter]MCR8644425.1 HAD-IIB family hydrolase [Paenibacillus radicibacter]
MSRQVFITDLDGTLLRSDQTLSNHTVDTLTCLLEQDTIVTFATARGSISAQNVVGRVPWKYPVILYNGALLMDWTNDRVIDGYWLDQRVTNEVIAVGRQYGITPLLFTLDANDRERVWHERLVRRGVTEFVRSRKDDPRFVEVAKLQCPDDERTLAVTYIGLKDELEPILADVNAKLGHLVHAHMLKDYYIEDHYFLEFSHLNGNKKDGLKLWAQHMGIELADTVIFGDHLNDLGLFEVGGTKIAVANAHESIIQMADQVILSNNEDGVANYVRDRIGNSE